MNALGRAGGAALTLARRSAAGRDVAIYQACYLEEHFGTADPAFIPLDIRREPNQLWYETGLFLRHYHLGLHRRSAYSGVVSPKFGLKTRLPGQAFIDFIEKNPGHDVYFINPFPINAYYAFNVWDHAEIRHAGILPLAQELFHRAGTGWDLYAQGRNAHDTLLYCNYWVGNAAFWERFIDLILRLVEAVRGLPERWKERLHALDPKYPVPTPFLPFVFERVFSTLLLHDRSIKALAFPHSRRYILESGAGSPDEPLIGEALIDIIDEIDRRGEYNARDREIFRAARTLKMRLIGRVR
jgi:hypothetical protein